MGSVKHRGFLLTKVFRASAPPLAGRGIFLTVSELVEFRINPFTLTDEKIDGLLLEQGNFVECAHAASI